jgi:hypothetical protein
MQTSSSWRLLQSLGCASFLLALAACGDPSEAVQPSPRVESESESEPWFEEVTAAAGLEVEGNSWGIAWGDVDGDGWQDLVSTNHGEDLTLHRNEGDGTFRLRDTPRKPGDKHGAAWADFDRDGDEDLLVLTGAERGMGEGRKFFYVNLPRGLVERADAHGLELAELRGRMPFWIDWNQDGELDVLVTCAKRENSSSQLFLQHDGAFSRAHDVQLGREQSMFAQCTSMGALGPPHVVVHAYKYPQSVHELGREGPSDVTEAFELGELAGVEDVAIGDFDGDGTTDFFLARAHMGSEILQESETHLFAKVIVLDSVRGISFRCAGPVTVAAHPMIKGWWLPEVVFIGGQRSNPPEMPFEIDAAEAEGEWTDALVEGLAKGVFAQWDRASDLWSIRVHGPQHEQVTLEVKTDGEPLREVEALNFVPGPSAPAPALLLQGDGDFTNRAERAGMSRLNALGVAAADFDNDMDLDLYVLCGSSLRNLPNVLYENLGGGEFRAVSGAGGAAGADVGVADGVAVADFDRDGFLDLAVSNGREIGPRTQGPLQLFRNRGNANHWLRLRLIGRGGAEPIGACVEVEAGGRVQYRTLGTHVHRGAQDERILHFGLGASERADRVTVRWPAGESVSLLGVQADQVLEVNE